VPPLRGLGHVLGQIAHPLQVGRDVQGGDHRTQVGRDRRLPRDGVRHLGLHLAVEHVDLGVPLDHHAGGLDVGSQKSLRGLAHRSAHGLGHGHQQPAHLLEVGPEFLAHRHVLYSSDRRPAPR
jgi:hypothetical protein